MISEERLAIISSASNIATHASSIVNVAIDDSAPGTYVRSEGLRDCHEIEVEMVELLKLLRGLSTYR